MKRMISAIMGVAAMALASGCSDDSSDSGTISCNFPSLKICGTSSGTAKQCTDEGGTVVGSCPGAELLKCVQAEGTAYYYDQTMVDLLKSVNATDPCAAISDVN